MPRLSRGLIDSNNIYIHDVVAAQGQAISGSYSSSISIKESLNTAPLNPFNPQSVGAYANYTTGPISQSWFSSYDHFLWPTGSSPRDGFYGISGGPIGPGPNFGLGAAPQIAKLNVNNPLVTMHHPAMDNRGQVSFNSGSYAVASYRSASNALGITSIAFDAAASIYQNNIDTQLVTANVGTWQTTNVDRTFVSSSRAVYFYRNNNVSARTYVRVANVRIDGQITLENELQISTTYNQIFNSAINVGNNRVIAASQRGGNEFKLWHFIYNSSNNYTYGETTVVSTQHVGSPCLAYISDDVVVYFMTHRNGATSGQDRYIRAYMYDISSFPPTQLGSYSEFDYGRTVLGYYPQAVAGRKYEDIGSTYGIWTCAGNDTGHKPIVIPWECTIDPDAGTYSFTWEPGTSTKISPNVTTASSVYASDMYQFPITALVMGQDPSDTGFYYLIWYTPRVLVIMKQDTTTGELATESAQNNVYPVNNTSGYLRSSIHWYGPPGNGHGGLPCSNWEAQRPSCIIVGENGIDNYNSGDYQMFGGGLLLSLV